MNSPEFDGRNISRWWFWNLWVLLFVDHTVYGRNPIAHSKLVRLWLRVDIINLTQKNIRSYYG